MILRCCLARSWALFPLLLATALASTNTVEFFGLTHAPLGAAAFSSNGGFQLVNIGTNGDDGVRSELGATDSGVFISPYTSYVEMGYRMHADVYGSFNGQSNTLLATIYGYRADYGEFYAGADYSPLGATNLTFQLWNGYALVVETTLTNGEVFMYGEYASPPRVNPWWRQGNGAYGEWIEFAYPLPVTLPGRPDWAERAYGNRIFIRPNGATGVVDYVSRTDVFGSGGLNNFSYGQMQLGVFGHAHTAFSQTKFRSSLGALRIEQTAPAPGVEEGVVIQLEPSERAVVNLEPLELALPDTNGVRHSLAFIAIGTKVNYPSQLGVFTLINTNGVLEFSTSLGEGEDTEEVTVEVFSDDTPAGSSTFVRGSLPARIEGAPRIVSFDATADTFTTSAGIGVTFDREMTMTFSNGSVLAGNRIQVRAGQLLRFADVNAMAVTAMEIPSFTITDEPTDAITLPRLEISRSGTNVVLRWPDPAQAYRLEMKTPVDGWASSSRVDPLYTNGIATVRLAPPADTVFFRLQRSFYPYNYND